MEKELGNKTTIPDDMDEWNEIRNFYEQEFKQKYRLDTTLMGLEGSLFEFDLNKKDDKIVKCVHELINDNMQKKVPGEINFNFYEKTMCVFNIKNYQLNQIIRQIIRQNYTGIYFNESIINLNLDLMSFTDGYATFAFFHIYMLNFIKLKKITVTTKIQSGNNYNAEDNKLDLSSFFILDYLIKNNNNAIEIQQDYIKIAQFNKSVFDILKLKINLKFLSININDYIVDIEQINIILPNLCFLETFKIKNAKKIKSNNKDEFSLFVQNLKKLNYLSKITISNLIKYFTVKSDYVNSDENNLVVIKNSDFKILIFDLFKNNKYEKIKLSCQFNTLDFDGIDNRKIEEVINKKFKLKLFFSIENCINFNFLKIKSINCLDIGLLDLKSAINLIKYLEDKCLDSLKLKLKDTVKIDTNEEIDNLFVFLNNPNYHIENFSLINCKNMKNDISAYLIENYLKKDKFVKSFYITYFLAEHFSFKSNNFKNSNLVLFTYLELQFKEIEVVLFALKNSANKIIKRRPIIINILNFLKKAKNKEIFIENNSEIILKTVF